MLKKPIKPKDPQGKPKYITKSFVGVDNNGNKKQFKVWGKTEIEAIKKLARLQAQYEAGLITFNTNTTFKRWAEEWLETYRKPRASSKTYKDTEQRINTYFMPALGALKMSEIRPTHIQKCINQLEGKSLSLQKKCKGNIYDLFQKAVSSGIINKTPYHDINMPAGTSGKRRSLTEAEKKAFFKVMDSHKHGLFFGIMLGCGLRPGEVRALVWPNINLKEGTITITSAIETASLNVKTPKTRAGYRTIPLPNWLWERLKQIKVQSMSFLFSSKTGGPITEQRYKRAWSSFHRLMDIEAGAQTYRNEVIVHSPLIGQDLTPYYLRHTYATSLAEAGVDMKTAQYLLGHATIAMTAQIYTHVTSKMLDSAREKINAATAPLQKEAIQQSQELKTTSIQEQKNLL